MKKMKIGFTAIALIAGICSVVVAKAKAFANTAYWINSAGQKVLTQPSNCSSGPDVCATAYDINDVPTGTVLFFRR